MDSKHLNRIKVVLAEKEKSNKWLAEQLGKDQATISKWVTNTTQPEALIELGEDLDTARQLINRVRQRAMNSAYVKDFNDPTKDAANYKIGLYPAAGWTQEYARKALRTEMRLEKALEGERYFDLVRWGIAKDVMTKYFEQEKDNRVYYQNAQFNDGEEYFPIPVAQYNFSLGRYTQNPGYPQF